MANGNGKKDPPKKSIFETMMSPYTETIKSIGKGVRKYINPEMPVSKMKSKGVKDIETFNRHDQGKAPKDFTVHHMKKEYVDQGQGKHDYFLKQDNEQIMKDLRRKEDHPINKKMKTTYNEKFQNPRHDLIEGDKNL